MSIENFNKKRKSEEENPKKFGILRKALADIRGTLDGLPKVDPDQEYLRPSQAKEFWGRHDQVDPQHRTIQEGNQTIDQWRNILDKFGIDLLTSTGTGRNPEIDRPTIIIDREGNITGYVTDKLQDS